MHEMHEPDVLQRGKPQTVDRVASSHPTLLVMCDRICQGLSKAFNC